MAGSVGVYTQGWLPWSAVKSTVGTWSRQNLDTSLGMGLWSSNAAQNEETSWDVYLDVGTWKYAQINYRGTNMGIYSVQLDGVEKGTIDAYNAANGDNQYNEVTGIVVTVPKVYTFTLKMATKNASSSAYKAQINSCAWIRTSGTGSTPAGTDTPGYTWMYLPWMGTKAHTTWETRDQGSGLLGGGWLRSGGAQNAEISWDIWLDAGTYKCALVYRTNSDAGIFHIQLDGVDKGTVDSYAASFSNNNYSEVTGITVATAGVKTFKLKMATKNASSSNYAGNIQSVAWIRTGA